MKIQTTLGSGFITVTPSESRLDAAVAQSFKGALIDLISQGHNRIILDMSTVEFMDSGGLGAIVAASRAVRNGGALVICAVPPRLKSIFELTRLGTVIPIHSDRASAEAALKIA